jgi:general secretion pathway protein L
MEGRQDVLLVLRDLTERIPDDTYLQNFQLQGNDVTMQGYSERASSLVPLLLESPHLASLKTNWITKDPRNQGRERFNFSAKVKDEEGEDQ